ncbi:MAG: hypothetical protein HFH59_17580 [Lachnospiraceae bacterium]|nr:hypothetical protein [Lachnospiraceae bacterium]
MTEMFDAGLDNELETTEELDNAEGLGETPAEKKPKRRPFHIWTVGGTGYKLKLTTRMIGALEKKYRTNVMNLVTADGMPPLSVMLTIIQAAASPWHHGFNYKKAGGCYDSWCTEGGNQMELLSKVIMPTLAVSGFFTQDQADSVMKDVEDMDLLL